MLILCIDPILVYVLPWQAQDHWSARGICTPASLRAFTKVVGRSEPSRQLAYRAVLAWLLGLDPT